MEESLLGTIGELFSTWWWLIALVVALAILREVVFGRRSRRNQKYRGGQIRSFERRRRSDERWQAEASTFDASRLGDPKAQMEFISGVDFEARRLLNKSEFGILRLLEKVTGEMGHGYRVMAQTSLGEVIAPHSESASDELRELAFRSINSKRLDFLVIDRTGMPALAVEYQGHGHYQNRAFMRDAVKREAVRKAGIRLLEIQAEYDVTVLESQVRSELQPSQAQEGRRPVVSSVAPNARRPVRPMSPNAR
ncbi:MAG: DUF2726 domain-containing protein [Chloroflexota bacterium]|nr:DUF2726 domain-containing protein [Chloroflexota bacterium]